MLAPIVEYIETKYEGVVFDDAYSEKTFIPTYRYNDSYVAIGCRKHYISVYFGCEKAAETVSKHTPFCRAQKGCVNFSYKRDIPYQALFMGIDCCFKK